MRLSSPTALRALVAIATLGFVAQVAWASAPGGRYQYSTCAGAAVYDNKTHLSWQRAPVQNPPATWTAATDYCRGVTYGNLTWRTPTVKELATLVDYTKLSDGGSTLTVDTSWFVTSASLVWSGTPDPSGALTTPESGGQATPSAYAVDFSTGQVVLRPMFQSMGVWCVSDAPAMNCQ